MSKEVLGFQELAASNQVKLIMALSHSRRKNHFSVGQVSQRDKGNLSSGQEVRESGK